MGRSPFSVISPKDVAHIALQLVQGIHIFASGHDLVPGVLGDLGKQGRRFGLPLQKSIQVLVLFHFHHLSPSLPPRR